MDEAVGQQATTPGRKQIFRQTAGGSAVRDVIARPDESLEGTPLLEPVMLGGKRVKARADLSALKDRAAAMIAALPPPLRALDKAEAFPVVASDRLQADTAALAVRLNPAAGRPAS